MIKNLIAYMGEFYKYQNSVKILVALIQANDNNSSIQDMTVSADNASKALWGAHAKEFETTAISLEGAIKKEYGDRLP